jgi:alpha-mannosidase
MKALATFALLALATPVFAEVSVKSEQLNPADLAWKFKRISGPSKSDIAQNAKITVEGNQLEEGAGPATVLANGRLPNNPLELTEEALLTNANANDGALVMDLGQAQPIAAVTSYSWHENPPDQGCRGPQVYTLSGSADGQNWTKLADVDTRPNTTGQNWNGQHGVLVSDTKGSLGTFRYLRFETKRTRSPLQGNVGLTGTLFSEIDVHTKATLSKAGDATIVGPVQVTDVWVVFKTHCDIGYTDTIENVLRKFRVPMMDSALAIIEQDRKRPQNERFSWMLAGWPLKHVLGPQQDPARKARIEQAVRDGALGIGAIPFSLHSETGELEDMVRGLGYASQIARQYGRPLPIAAKMTDVPCHSWVWPTMLKNAGVQFLQLGCNDNSGHLEVPHLFWWEGPDGSRVLCNFTPQYGSALVPPKGWPAKNYLAMIMTADNHGPPSPQDVENIRKVAAQHLPGARLHFGTLDDYARAISAEKPDIPVIRGDMPDTWIHGWMSMPIEAKTARNCRPLQPALDILDTELRAWGQKPAAVAPALAEAYEFSNLYSEHTFGPAGPAMGPWNSGTPRDLYGDEWKAARERGAYKKYEAVFDDKRAFAHKESEIVHRELTSRLELLAKSVNATGKRVVVYNGLPWKRSGSVEVDGRNYFVKDVPACGYVTIKEEPDQPSAPALDGNTLDTPFYRVTFDLKRGGVSSLVEKKTGRELVDQTSPYAVGQYLHERFDAARMREWHLAYSRPRGGQPAAFIKSTTPPGLTTGALTPTGWKLDVKNDGAADVATLTAGDTLGLAKGVAIVITLPRQQPTLDVEWRVTDKTADPTPEGGWICLPFAVEQPQFLLGRLAGPIDPTKDIVTGANKDLICLNSGMTISGKQGGLGLCPLDSPCVSLGEPGLWKYTMGDIAPKSSVFVNLYNNEWHTNFPEWTEGSWNSRVRIWPSADLAAPSWEARVPLLAAAADGPAGKLPASQDGLAVSQPGVLVTAFGENPDGKGTLLRLWDQSGASAEVTVTVPGKFQTATPVNLRGEKSGSPVRISDGKLRCKVGAYAPVSFILE